MPSPLTIHEDTQLKVISWDLVVGVRWYDIPTLASLERYRSIQERYFRFLDEGRALIVSYSDARSERLHFESGSRDLVEAVVTEAKTHLHGMAQIIAGDGFGAASVRSVLSGIQLAVRPDYPIRLFSDTKSALPWLEDILIEAERPDLARDIRTLLVSELDPMSF